MNAGTVYRVIEGAAADMLNEITRLRDRVAELERKIEELNKTLEESE